MKLMKWMKFDLLNKFSIPVPIRSWLFEFNFILLQRLFTPNKERLIGTINKYELLTRVIIL